MLVKNNLLVLIAISFIALASCKKKDDKHNTQGYIKKDKLIETIYLDTSNFGSYTFNNDKSISTLDIAGFNFKLDYSNQLITNMIILAGSGYLQAKFEYDANKRITKTQYYEGATLKSESNVFFDNLKNEYVAVNSTMDSTRVILDNMNNIKKIIGKKHTGESADLSFYFDTDKKGPLYQSNEINLHIALINNYQLLSMTSSVLTKYPLKEIIYLTSTGFGMLIKYKNTYDQDDYVTKQEYTMDNKDHVYYLNYAQ